MCDCLHIYSPRPFYSYFEVKIMACKICGRESCIESFHSIEEQEEFETKTGRYEPDEEWMNAPLGTPEPDGSQEPENMPNPVKTDLF